MRVLIAGATGFIGSALKSHLLERGHEVLALTRNPEKAAGILGPSVQIFPWDAKSTSAWVDAIEGAEAIVNLSGENANRRRWTPEVKRSLVQSRLDSGHALVGAVRRAARRPAVFVQASSTRFYGTRVDTPVTEASPAGTGFIADLTRQWESSTEALEGLGVRRVVLRLGAVLGAEGGALPRRALPFRCFAGGPIGRGDYYYPWIHMDDALAALSHLMDRTELAGPFNLVAPEAVRMEAFCRELGRTLRRPSWIRIPTAIPRLIYGEMVDESLLSGQNARPSRLLESGFRFRFPELRPALAHLLRR